MADNKLETLSEIFNQKFFRIPDFQRGYSWGKDQLEDFWDDINNLKEDKIHYTGLLTVEQVSKAQAKDKSAWEDDMWLYEKGWKSYYLIDGQQRLTTSIILINAILDRFDDSADLNFSPIKFWKDKFLYQAYKDTYKSFVFGYEKDNPSDEFFKTKILSQESSTSDKVPEQTLYTANLDFAKKYFTGKLDDIDTAKIEEVFRKLIGKFKFNFYEIDAELDVFVTFETMNNRGKELSKLELMKNRLIYLSTLLEDDQKIKNGLRKDINETWKTIYEYLGKNKENPLDDDDFLKNHWIVYFHYNRNVSNSYAKFLLNQHFTAKNTNKGAIKFSHIKDYINSLGACVKSWFYLYNVEKSTYSEETKEWIQKMNRLNMGAFPPLFMATMTKLTEEKFLPLIKAAEKFNFLVFGVSNRPSNTKNSELYRLANDFYKSTDKNKIDAVVAHVNWITEGEKGEGDTYEYFGWYDAHKFKANISDLFQKREGYYSWSALRYFLYEYELDLQAKAKGNTKVTWSDFRKRKKENSIEHIYPQTPTNDYWKEHFSGLKKKEVKFVMHSLGNLVLISQSKNSELQNKDFNFKKRHKDKKGNEVGFHNGSYSEIEVSQEENWTPQKIMERGERMLDFLERRWLSNTNTYESWELSRVELLKLGFLVEDKL